MPVRPVGAVPAGSDVFIDANILIYGLSGRSLQCRQFLDRCFREQLLGVTLLEVVNEVTHRLMVGEAYAKGLIPSRTAKALRGQHAVIPALGDYWQDTERLLALNLVLLPASESILRVAQHVRQSAALLTNDSMVVACMRVYHISFLASSDRDFERVPGITLFRPDDLP